MAGPMLTSASIVRCPHGGVAILLSATSRVLVAGSPILSVADQAIVTGCANTPAPCAKIDWLQGSARVLASGAPVVTEQSVGQAVTANRVPGGSPIVAVAASRVLTG